jgi:hypothetical protein
MEAISPKIIVGVPGTWQTRQEIVQSIAASSGGLLYAGDVLQDTATNEHFTLEIAGHDPALAKAFSIAGRRTMSRDEIKAIGSHTFTLYLSGKGGSTDRARTIMRVASGLLKAGGMAVKVESAGVAHNPGNWNALLESPELSALYHAFVTLVAGENVYYSCGMHNLGLPDATAPRSLPPGEAARLMEGFLLYTLYERPELSDGHTFSLSAESTLFRLQDNPCTMFAPDDPFHNPYGMWMLH